MPNRYNAHATTRQNCRDNRDHDQAHGRTRPNRTARHPAPSRTTKTPQPCGPIRAFSYGGGRQSTAALVPAAQRRIDFRTRQGPKPASLLHVPQQPSIHKEM
ncbi:hypothetical protein [Actinomadura montaniterrae]|uniref:hypothetical protein n=1 Tax=Actinomadura montaniterrae TaxID=1803903 RepID=UPI001CEF78B5|nr:hypothetical protein [Actinomadura montaniterrae]